MTLAKEEPPYDFENPFDSDQDLFSDLMDAPFPAPEGFRWYFNQQFKCNCLRPKGWKTGEENNFFSFVNEEDQSNAGIQKQVHEQVV